MGAALRVSRGGTPLRVFRRAVDHVVVAVPAEGGEAAHEGETAGRVRAAVDQVAQNEDVIHPLGLDIAEDGLQFPGRSEKADLAMVIACFHRAVVNLRPILSNEDRRTSSARHRAVAPMDLWDHRWMCGGWSTGVGTSRGGAGPKEGGQTPPVKPDRPSLAGCRQAGPTRFALLFSYHQPRRAIQGVDAASLPGCPTTTAELSALGFSPLTLRIRDGQVPLPGGVGMNWDTVGDVPTAPGTYLFTVSDAGALHVTYASLTTHLWMVTKGRLPTSASRPGQRYGRPKYAGTTRQRVNLLVTAELRRGHTVLHWMRALPDAPVDPTELAELLKRDEEALTQRWHLRQCGWNRG